MSGTTSELVPDPKLLLLYHYLCSLTKSTPLSPYQIILINPRCWFMPFPPCLRLGRQQSRDPKCINSRVPQPGLEHLLCFLPPGKLLMSQSLSFPIYEVEITTEPSSLFLIRVMQDFKEYGSSREMGSHQPCLQMSNSPASQGPEGKTVILWPLWSGVSTSLSLASEMTCHALFSTQCHLATFNNMAAASVSMS